MLVLEMSVAALIAQLPQASLEEVVGMLSFVAGAAEEAEDVAVPAGEEQLAQIRHWAHEMLGRVMVSRKASRGTAPQDRSQDKR
ncbi:hypothetical protein M0638_18985 [Roseomonas sp. NAR14]|uniref:Uncharacterized protein n=1 Tax=Roseomonas acroporae TaxID=2937791 RepID=A0A9X2BYX6_9PROT|nr:hypothetical protein [Roseomonas acroporae]MCK8786465.1 hypothetical protein [Roseomonas acroporae]